MKDPAPLVIVIDDDPLVRRGTARLIRMAGYDVETYSGAQDFLGRDRHDGPCCLVLDVRMPGLSGLDLQEALAARGIPVPIIFMTGHGDVPITVRAMKAGAAEFLEKPVDGKVLLGAVAQSIEKDRLQRARHREIENIRSRLGTLTRREREVLELVVRGLMNKEIARNLGTSEKTVKVHRSRVMDKMKAKSVAELVRLAEKAGA